MKIFIKTYGCQMNERDSEALAGMLAKQQHEIVADEFQADVLIFNTCSVREQAEQKAIGKMGIMKRLKKEKPELIIGAVGCMAQARKEELFRLVPHLDFVLGTGQLHRLPELLASIAEDRRRCAMLAEGEEVLTGMGMHYLPDNPVSAFIAITRGCNRFCSYCIVPYVRGREISRSIADVVAEARELAASGVREIMLLGQNVAAFGLGGNVLPPPDGVSPFADLLYELDSIDGLRRIRFTSPYPTYFNDKLIAALQECRKVAHNLHLPLQSGSDRILKAMNRQYTEKSYLEIVNKIKRAVPDMTFSTDVIVGFPGEREEDFAATRALLNEVGFDNEFIFKYSPRQGTAAADMPDQISQEIKESRNQILLGDMKQRLSAHLKAMIGSTQEILVEGVSKRNPDRWSGRSSTGFLVNFAAGSPVHPGELLKLRIVRAGAVSLLGEPVA